MTSGVDGDDDPWVEQRHCLALLLKSRLMLRALIKQKVYTERKGHGDLTALLFMQGYKRSEFVGG